MTRPTDPSGPSGKRRTLPRPAARFLPPEAATTVGVADENGDAPESALPLTKEDYEHLAEARHALRLFARKTELELAQFGVSPQQYLLLLAIKGFPGRERANITELAERLQVRHNAVIGLVNRAVASGFVERIHDPDALDRRVVHVKLTYVGERVLAKMVESLRAERAHVREALGAVLGVNNTPPN